MTVGDEILRSIVGHQVVVQNPHHPSASWRGQAVAATFDPSVLVEQADGTRVMLPLYWAAPVQESGDPS